MNKTLIFTATYNESKNINLLIEKILNLNLNVDILIVDDNSPDKTYEIVEKLKEKFNNIFLERRNSKLGLNTAHIFGYEFALKYQYKNLITMDADLSHDPDEIPNMIKLLDNNAFVIGSRYIKGGKNDMKKLRLLLSIIGNKFIKIILNSKGTEFTSSFRGFNLVKLKNFSFTQVESKGYSFFMETVIRINNSVLNLLNFQFISKIESMAYQKIPRIEILRTLFNVLKLFIIKH